MATATGATTNTAEGLEYFEKKVRPLLAAKCQMCHGAQLKSGGVDFSSVEGFVKARDEAALISLDNPGESRLLGIVGYTASKKMPPSGKLSALELEVFDSWISMGAPWPGAEQQEKMIPASHDGVFTSAQKAYWAFQPVSRPEGPTVSDPAWVSTPVDRFILGKLDEKGMKPAPPADKVTLLRRATLDLTGLPPTAKELEEFLADESCNAFEKVVDRLLDSPRYGERWGRHWLDVARYADSTGNDEDHRYPYAWRYRDYVIESFNNDVPYDQFVREQLAGDLLPAEDGSEINTRGIVATGFLALGAKAVAQQDKKKMLYDVYDEQVEIVSKSMLGLTVACARCHDHKFDPILTRDYYSLVGIFASTRSFSDPSLHVSKLLYKPLVPGAEYEAYRAEQTEIRNKQIELDNAADIEVEFHVDGLASTVAAYMIAAREVYEGGADAAAVAKKSGLDPAILDKWVAYLKPTAVPRAQLADWRDASMKSRTQIAAAYQEQFTKTLEEWHHDIRRWRREAIEMLKDGSMPPRPKPRFEPGNDRFFYDVYAARKAPFRFSDEEQKSILKPETQQLIATLTADLKQLKDNAKPEPPMADAVEEGEVVDQKVFIRGDYHAEGDDAPKVFPAIIAGFDQSPATSGSGRLELADWIASKDNPLTARVMVNRIWQKHFVEGIVRTPNNFGKLGSEPTHPKLLDYLATEFVNSGWSVKRMHKLIMLSSAYRMSSSVTSENAEKDSANQWLSHFNRRRMDVEEVRDGMLAIDGTIDYEMGGTLQSGFGTDSENSNDRLSIDPASSSRRMVYLPLRRANLPALLNLFDFGDAATSMGKRANTNVAPQALFMMNSDFVAKRARNLATDLLEEKDWSDSERMNHAFIRTLTRTPSADEVDQGLTYISQVRRDFDDVSPLDAWESFCRILLASNSYIYID